MVRRVLIVLGIAAAVVVIVYGGILALLIHGLTQADPYPAFMAEYQSMHARSYQEANRAFGDFVVNAFPIGSDAGDVIAQTTRGGFRVWASTPDSVELLWRRRAGPCGEEYWIVIDRDASGRIARTAGRLHWVCL